MTLDVSVQADGFILGPFQSAFHDLHVKPGDSSHSYVGCMIA